MIGLEKNVWFFLFKLIFATLVLVVMKTLEIVSSFSPADVWNKFTIVVLEYSLFVS